MRGASRHGTAGGYRGSGRPEIVAPRGAGPRLFGTSRHVQATARLASHGGGERVCDGAALPIDARGPGPEAGEAVV